MVDLQTVCCMCGDVGFPDKLFRCHNCRNRFQHSYCSNYYRETGRQIDVCDWCRSEERSIPRSHGASLKKSLVRCGSGSNNRSESSSGGRIKQPEVDEESEVKGRSSGGAPSPRPTPRRYKLLKDVMC